MHIAIESAQDVVAFSVKMVPDGHFDQDETERRRRLWKLWVVLPQQYHQHYPKILAERFQRPVEWVREVLNLSAP